LDLADLAGLGGRPAARRHADKNYGLKIANPQEARDILSTVNTIADAVASRATCLVAPTAA
jgi:hypothetical protein